MKSQKKVVISFSILFVIILAIGITLITVFAAANRTVNSKIRITYKAINIDGKVSAKSKLANAATPVDMLTENNDKEIVFKAADNSASANSSLWLWMHARTSQTQISSIAVSWRQSRMWSVSQDG